MGFQLVPKSVTLNDPECSPKNLVLAVYHLWQYSQGITPSEGVKV